MQPKYSLDGSGILLVGSNRDQLVSLRESLSSLAARIVLAPSAAAAAVLLRRYRFHVLTVDVESLAEDLPHSVETLREHAVASQTSVIFLSENNGPPPPSVLELLGEAEVVSRGNARALILRKLTGSSNDGLETTPALQEKIARLERANEALRNFAWSASHDLKEPLRGVVGIGDLLVRNLDSKLDAGDRELLNLMVENGRRTYVLLESLRQFIVFADTDQVSNSLVDCTQVMRKVTDLLRAAISQSGAAVTWQALPSLLSDEAILTRVLLNLVSNAIKYRSDRPPEVKVTWEHDGVSSVFSVIDNGRGIDPKDHDSIFRPFWRADSRKTSGSGLGLALCRAAVQRLGGQIWVQAGSDGGSIFKFSLPGAAPDSAETSVDAAK